MHPATWGIASPRGFYSLWSLQLGMLRRTLPFGGWPRRWQMILRICSKQEFQLTCPMFLAWIIKQIVALTSDEFQTSNQKSGKKSIDVLGSESHHAAKGKQSVFRAAFVGVKGDWPWLRKCMALRTGFTSSRVCHLCPGFVSCKNIINHFFLPVGKCKLHVFIWYIYI